jgi:hypothetical protein
MKVYEDLPEIQAFSLTMNETKDSVNVIVSKFNLLPLQKIKTIDQLQKLFNDLPGLLIEMLPSKDPVKLMGVILKPAKVIELMELDTTELKQLISETIPKDVWEFMQLCRFSSKHGFELDPDKFEERLNRYRIYATTTKEQETAKAYLELIQSVEKLLSLGMELDVFRYTKPTDLWLRGIGGNNIEMIPHFYNQLLRK